jgi:AraC-like DNA-binding protein
LTCFSKRRLKQKEAGSGVRVLSWNLWWRHGPWERRREAIAATMVEVRPDLCGLQEVWSAPGESLSADLAERLGMHWCWRRPRRAAAREAVRYPSAMRSLAAGRSSRMSRPTYRSTTWWAREGWRCTRWDSGPLFEYPARVRLVGVHFKPWGMSPFAGMPAAELRDRWVPVDAVWHRSLDRIRNQVGDIASPAEALRVLEEELRSRLAKAPSRGLDLVQHTGRRLEASHGAVPVGALADAAGVSGNHLATQIKSHVGVTPKRVARIRFARLILSVEALRPVDWPELAQTAGYFDQAHFSREFKDFTGHTPTEYLALRRRFPAEQGFPPDSGPMPAD